MLAALPLFATGLIKPRAARAAPVLRVGAALPDPPFEFNANDGPAGFDITLMQRIAGMIGREWQLVPYKGTDFNGIFAGLDDGSYDLYCLRHHDYAGTQQGRRFLSTLCGLWPVARCRCQPTSERT